MPDQPVIKINHWWAGLVILAAVLVRLLAALGDLEIDEVWTMAVVKSGIPSVVHIFLLRHDNNHLLNTIILYGLGTNVATIGYRLPAVLASIGSVWLGGRIALRQAGPVAMRIVWMLVGSSYMLVLYGSEARGYSYAVFFGYWSWLLLMRIESERRWRDVVLYSISSSLGFLAHLTYVYCFVGFIVWSIWKWVRRPNAQLPMSQVVPSAVAGMLYLVFIRGMMIGGGPKTSVLETAFVTLSVAMGGPLDGESVTYAALLGAVMTIIGFVSVWNSDRATAVSNLTIIVVAPAAVLLITEHSLLYPRYFLIPVAFGLLIIGEALSRWWVAGKAGQRAVIVFCSVYLIGNVWWNVLLMNHGRGDYSHALKWMAEQKPGSKATVSSDHDFRNGLMVTYYAARDGLLFEYIAEPAIPREGTDWTIRHTFDGEKPPPQVVTDRSGTAYRFKALFSHHGLTGWNWWIYQRVDHGS